MSLRLDYALHGQGLVYDAGDAARRERGGDHADVAAGLGPLALSVGAADDEAAHAARYGPVYYLRLLAADEYGVRVGQRGSSKFCGRAMYSSPETLLTVQLSSLTSVPSSTLSRLKSGTSSTRFSAMVCMS